MYNISTRLNQQTNRVNNNATYNYRTLNMFDSKQEDVSRNNNYNMSTRTQSNQSNTSFPLSYTFNSNMNSSSYSNNSQLLPQQNRNGKYANRAIRPSDLSVGQQVDIDNTLKINKNEQNKLLNNFNNLDNCDFLSSEYTRLNDNLIKNDNRCKEANINRFEGIANSSDLKDHIFWNFAKNTQLEARDEYKNKMKK